MYQELVTKQKEYFLKGNTLRVNERISQLKKLREIIVQNTDAIQDALYQDFKKSKFESYVSEVAMSLNSLDDTISNIESWASKQFVSGSILNYPSTEYYIAHPYGVSLIISPWNYPFLLTIDPLIASIAAGNCSIVKPSELTPHTSHLIEKMIASIYDEAFVKVIQGDAKTTDELLKCTVDKIFFTGSPRVGKIVYQAAAELMVPVTLELGGKSPCVVTESADLKIAAKRIVWGKFMNAGQTCVAPDYLYVHDSIVDKLKELLKDTIRKFYGEDIQNNSDYPRIINGVNFDRLVKFLDSGEIIEGGKSDKGDFYISPTLLTNIDWESDIMQEEIFGPILPILPYQNISEIVELINKKPSPLACYLFTGKEDEKDLFIKQVTCGGMCINDTISHLLNPDLPFGGVGNSGIGVYHGYFGFQAFSHSKGIVERGTRIDIPIRYPPYSNKLLKLIKYFFEHI